MKLPHKGALWIAAAGLSLVLLLFVLGREHRSTQRRFAVQVTPRPESGHTIFEVKGCATCHGLSAAGTASGPALRERGSKSSLPQLVVAMWNHAPRMWAAMQAQDIPYPSLNYEETGQLIAYLYISGFADNNGNIDRGREQFSAKRCDGCHPNATDPLIASSVKGATPLQWSQALWNHATGMRARMKKAGIVWPTFAANDLRDLFAYVRHQNGSSAGDFAVPAGDPDKGWQVFQQRSCVRCHAVTSGAGRIGTELGPDRPLPPTFSEFGAALINHVPQMEHAIGGGEWPMLEGNDINDVTVFLYTLHYLEPSGSPQLGKSVFSWRGCNRCHGDEADGGSGPPLRGRGQTYTSVRLATALWKHGERMYRRHRDDGQPWPMLQESDVGSLLTFLNTSLER